MSLKKLLLVGCVAAFVGVSCGEDKKDETKVVKENPKAMQLVIDDHKEAAKDSPKRQEVIMERGKNL